MASSSGMDDLLSRLNSITQFVTDDTPSTSNTLDENSSAYEKMEFYHSLADSHVKKIDPAIKKQREKLPICKRKAELIKVFSYQNIHITSNWHYETFVIIQQALQDNQILIIIGETGSGKTTQIPQYIVEAGLAISGKVGCTQLRRMAAKAVAKRVAKEHGTELGKEVGYTIRFEDKTDATTKIQLVISFFLLK